MIVFLSIRNYHCGLIKSSLRNCCAGLRLAALYNIQSWWYTSVIYIVLALILVLILLLIRPLTEIKSLMGIGKVSECNHSNMSRLSLDRHTEIAPVYLTNHALTELSQPFTPNLKLGLQIALVLFLDDF